MIPLDSLALYVVACVLLVLTPGPNLMYLISRTLCQGRTAGIVSLAGTTSGLLFYAVAAASSTCSSRPPSCWASCSTQ